MPERKEEKQRVAGVVDHDFTPYFDQTYELPESVKALYPEVEPTFTTPAFMTKRKAFTSQERMMHFLSHLCKDNDRVRMRILGRTVEGREIPMLIFSTSLTSFNDFFEKPTVWLQAQIHGNEPAAGESALVMAQKLAEGELGDELLEDINVIIIPRMNPDSAYYFVRNSIREINGNRDHINLEMPELQAIHSTFNRYLPEVVIDAHEYGATPQYEKVGAKGALKYHDVLLLGGKNLNIPEELRKLNDQLLIEEAFKALEAKNYSYGKYFTVSASDEEKPTLLEGGVDAGTGRNTFALRPSLTVLVETLGIGIGRENFFRRVDAQVVTHTAIMQTVAKYAQEVKQAVARARYIIKDGSGKGDMNEFVVLKSERTYMGERTVKGIDIATGKVVNIPVSYYSSTDAEGTLLRKRPNAYIFSEAYGSIAEKLRSLGIIVNQLAADVWLDVQAYEVEERTVKLVDGRAVSDYKTNPHLCERFFKKGTYYVRSDQPTGNLLSLALEPESENSYFSQHLFPVTNERELPVYRYMGTIDFPLERKENEE